MRVRCHVGAQRFFDQGLRYVYAFNHAEAIRSFQRAPEIDPGLAMAQWGVALALGSNINDEFTPGREKQALDAMAQARLGRASTSERAYIAVLAKRYSPDAKAIEELRAPRIEQHGGAPTRRWTWSAFEGTAGRARSRHGHPVLR